MFDLHARARARGPVFNGEAQRQIQRGTGASERQIADQAKDFIRRDLIVVPRHPTGYYRRHIRVIRAGGRHEVVDSNVVYGPWLEGVSQRNRTTRFKGYAFFRRASQRFSRVAGAIADRILQQYTRGL